MFDVITDLPKHALYFSPVGTRTLNDIGHHFLYLKMFIVSSLPAVGSFDATPVFMNLFVTLLVQPSYVLMDNRLPQLPVMLEEVSCEQPTREEGSLRKVGTMCQFDHRIFATGSILSIKEG